MGSIAAPDRVLLRQPVDTQTSLERLYFLGFPNIWTGRVNESPARGDRSITYDGGAMAAGFAFADLTSYGAGLEIWFSSTGYNLKDQGVRRLRTITSVDGGATGTIAVDWFDDMSLLNNDFITIKHFYPPWPKYSYFTAAGPVFYKDGPDGTTYAASGAANATPAPHVIMGRHYASELTGASLDISFDATNSVDVAGGGGGATYAWKVTPNDGNALFVDTGLSTSALAAPTLRVTDEGEWWVHVTVTIDARSTLAHRAVIVGGGITEFVRSPITSQYDSTDISVTLGLTGPEVGSGIRGPMTWADVQDHTLVIIASDDWYGATQKCISFRDDDVYDDRQHIVFCGYLTLENMDLVDDGTGVVEVQAVSLLDMFLYSLSLTGATAVDQWYEMLNTQMTVAGNLLHLLRWHSTLLDIADWWLPWSDTVRRSANEEFSEGNMLERARTLCRARLMGMTANPQGEIFVETDLNLRSFADRAAATTTLILTEADVAGTKRARTRRRGDLVRILADGGYSTGVMGSYQPFFAASQNVAKSEARPALVHVDRLMVPSQAETNRVAARLQAVANRRYIEVDLAFAGNYREIFSPAGQQWTDLGNLFAAALVANISGDIGLVDALCVPRQVTHSHDNATGQTTVSAVFDVEAPVELEGRTITPPAVPSEDPSDGGWDFPEAPEWPAIPDVTLLTNLLAFDAAEGCWLRFAGAGDWTERNGARAGTDDDDVQGGWDPHWFAYYKQNTSDVNASILWACQQGHIWRSTDGGQTWQDVTPNIPDPPNAWGDAIPATVADLTFVQRTDNIHANKEHYFIAEWQEAGGDWRGWLLKTDDDGVLGSWTWESLGSEGLSFVNTFDTDAEGWVFVARDITGGPTSGEWTVADFHNAPGSLAVTLGPKTGCFLIAGVWRYTPTYPVIVSTGDTVSFWAKGVGAFAHSNWIRIHYTDGTKSEDGLASNYVGWQLLTTTVAANRNGKQIAYIDLESHTGLAQCAGGPLTAYWDDGSVNLSGAEIRPLWMDCDSESGTYLYLTVWRNDILYLQKRLTADLSLSSEVSLGACTEAELNALTYWAAPFTPTFDQDIVYVFGRMTAPAGLAGVQHVIESTDGGTTWASVESSWAGDLCGALRVEGDGVAVARTMYAVRNIAAAAAEFYEGPEGGALTYRSDLPFDVGVGVNVDALTVNGASQVAVGANGTSAIMVAVADSPHTAWSDITDSFPSGATAEVVSLTYI